MIEEGLRLLQGHENNRAVVFADPDLEYGADRVTFDVGFSCRKG